MLMLRILLISALFLSACNSTSPVSSTLVSPPSGMALIVQEKGEKFGWNYSGVRPYVITVDGGKPLQHRGPGRSKAWVVSPGVHELETAPIGVPTSPSSSNAPRKQDFRALRFTAKAGQTFVLGTRPNESYAAWDIWLEDWATNSIVAGRKCADRESTRNPFQ